MEGLVAVGSTPSVSPGRGVQVGMSTGECSPGVSVVGKFWGIQA